jgi:RNA polymerase sigma factor (sigma-70 family)
MNKTTSSPILHMLRRIVEDRGIRALPDRDLLQMFSDRQDQSAFEVMLRRHGPMFLSVCRAVLGTDASAEDAFQATFIVLVRKASSIRNRASLASWLHGVAYRTALKARVQTATRQKYEARTPEIQPSADDSLTWREVRQVLHEELNKLPKRYREPLVLFHLEGVTQQAAASQLGVAKSTLRERLDRGRMLLRQGLISRGMGASVILAATAWPYATASASVPGLLMHSTAKAARTITMGGAVGTVVSDRVAALAGGVGNAMLVTKGKLIAAATLLVLVSFGATAKLAQIPAAEPRAKLHAARQMAPKQ